MTAILKGVQSINNCWGGEGPVFNPDYMCGAQYMITQGTDHYFFSFRYKRALLLLYKIFHDPN